MKSRDYLNKSLICIICIGILWNVYKIYFNSKDKFYDLTEITVQNPNVNVGVIKKDSIKYVHYILKNSGNVPIKLIELKPDCSCTRANVDSSNLSENNLDIIVSFDNSSKGAFNRTVLVYLNTKDSPKVLSLKGFVVK